ncbi:MAG: phosphatase PAP2 family protein [Pirellulales bacterium]
MISSPTTIGVGSLPTRSAPNWRNTLLLVGGLALAGVLVVPFDGQVAHFFLGGGCPGELDKLFDLAEVFGHGTGAFLVILTVWVLDPLGWRAAAWLAGATYGAGMGANVLKMLVERTRPNAVVGQIIGWDTFQAWIPLWTAGRGGQSFPSGHMATAVGLAVGLATLYPRGRWLFGVFAVLAGCQRIESGAHFPSDVLWGAAVGLLVGSAVMQAYTEWAEKRERSNGQATAPAGS